MVLVARITLYYMWLTRDSSISRADTELSGVLQTVEQSSMKKGMFFLAKYNWQKLPLNQFAWIYYTFHII